MGILLCHHFEIVLPRKYVQKEERKGGDTYGGGSWLSEGERASVYVDQPLMSFLPLTDLTGEKSSSNYRLSLTLPLE